MPPPDDDRSSRLSVLMFTDLVDSAALARQLGDAVYVGAVLEPHNVIFRRLLGHFPGAEEIKHTGDGFLATFANASDAVQCALEFHHQLRRATWKRVTPRTRVGIHLGEAIVIGRPEGTWDVAGDVANMAARVMGLAEAGQTLVTRPVFDSARQSGRVVPPALELFAHGSTDVGERPEPSTPAPEVRWLAHGRYRFKGTDEPWEVYEVGIPGEAPLRPPADSEKARRTVSEEEALILGWRPGPGLQIPRRESWILVQKLGEGGFGEVWLAGQRRTKEKRVFKFCFDVDRLRSFKRELTFFRLMQQHLGERDDIARLYDVQLDHPPFFLESEYVPGGNLKHWVDHHGGLNALPLEFRVRLLSQIAGAVAAAHSLGIIHKDIKPSNILIAQTPPAPERGPATTPASTPAATPEGLSISEGGRQISIRPRLCDFGIGVLADPRILAQGQITQTGFTESVVLGNDSSRTGTRLYAPPESQLGKPATTAGDVYALGVMLYQLVAGDLSRPFGTGWEEDVQDELLREDILACTHRDPARRLPSAADLVTRLETLGPRAYQLDARRRALQTARRLRQARRALLLSLIALAIVVGLGVFSYMQWQRANQNAVTADNRRQVLLRAVTNIRLATDPLLRHRATLAEGESDYIFLVNLLRSAYEGGHQTDNEIRQQLAAALSNLSFAELLGGPARAGDALRDATEAKDYAPERADIWINLAHADLFSRRYAEAEKIYREFKDAPISDSATGAHTGAAQVRADFKMFREWKLHDAGIEQEMRKIEGFLGP